MRNDRLYLDDIREAMARIESRIPAERGQFDGDDLVQVRMLYNLQIVGEAVNNLSQPLLARYPEQPWRQIIGLRHTLVHAYFNIDLDRIWKVIQQDIPSLKRTITTMIAELDALPAP